MLAMNEFWPESEREPDVKHSAALPARTQQPEPIATFCDEVPLLEDLVEALDRAAACVSDMPRAHSVVDSLVEEGPSKATCGNGARCGDSKKSSENSRSNNSKTTMINSAVRIRRRPLADVGRDELARRTATAWAAANAGSGSLTHLSKSKGGANACKEAADAEQNNKTWSSSMDLCVQSVPSVEPGVYGDAGDGDDEYSRYYDETWNCSPPQSLRRLSGILNCTPETKEQQLNEVSKHRNDHEATGVPSEGVSAVASQPAPAPPIGGFEGSPRASVLSALMSTSRPSGGCKSRVRRRRRPMLRFFAILFYPIAFVALHWGLEAVHRGLGQAPLEVQSYLQSLKATIIPRAPDPAYPLLPRTPGGLSPSGWLDRPVSFPLPLSTPEQVALPLPPLTATDDISATAPQSLSSFPRTLLHEVQKRFAGLRRGKIGHGEEEAEETKAGGTMVAAWSRGLVHAVLRPLPPGDWVGEAPLEGAV